MLFNSKQFSSSLKVCFNLCCCSFSLFCTNKKFRDMYICFVNVSAVRGNVCVCLWEQLQRGLKKRNVHHPFSFLTCSSACHSISLPSLQGLSAFLFFYLFNDTEKIIRLSFRLKSYSYLLLCRPNTNPFIIKSL